MVGGRLGLLLAVPPGYATAIFPTAGIAMAASVIGGPRTLPSIYIGSFVLNTWIGAAAEPQNTYLLVGFDSNRFLPASRARGMDVAPVYRRPDALG